MRSLSLPRLFALTVTTALLAACGSNGASGTSPVPGAGPANGPVAQSALRTVSAATPTPAPNPCYCPPHQRICSDVACTVQPRGPANAAPAAKTPVPTPTPCGYCVPGHECPQDCAQSVLRETLSATPTPTPNPCYCPPHRVCSDIACQLQPRDPANAAAAPAAKTPVPTPTPCGECLPGRACPQYCTQSQPAGGSDALDTTAGPGRRSSP